MKPPLSAIEYYDKFAPEYDILAKQHHWISPQILFGMLFDNLKSNTNLLDVGIGTGLSSLPFHKMGVNIFGIDGSDEMLNLCGQKKFCQEIAKIDLESENLPYPDSFFDYVISNGVFYFIHSFQELLHECLRVLKPGGLIAFNYEEQDKGKDRDCYRNTSNCVVSKLMKEKTGVTVYRNKREFVEAPIIEAGCEIIEWFKYYAYTSPQSSEDVYFTLVIARRKENV